MLTGTLWSTNFNTLQSMEGIPQPIYVGERNVTDPDYRMSLSPDPYWHWSTLKICSAGRGYFEQDGQRQVIGPGQAILFNKGLDGTAHGIDPQSNHWQFIRLSFSGADQAVNAITNRYSHICEIPLNHSIVRRLKTFNRGLQAQCNLDAQSGADLIWSILSSLMTIMESKAPIHSLVRSCMEWIFDHTESHRTISDCADQLGTNQSYLTRIFQEEMGSTPGAFLHETRLKHAMRLLLTEDIPIKEISYRCGYKNHSHFTRAFRALFNATPQEIRKNPEAWSIH